MAVWQASLQYAMGIKMKRNVSLDEISDGKLYGLNDMVKAGCDDCNGCSACCQGMGNSIILDPLDIYHLTKNLNKTLEELLIDKIELHIVDGIILPNLKMSEGMERCGFLSCEGRCEIHAFRPGICRLFPLGRYYENHSFQYFLQIHECKKENRTKVKVRKWIDTPDIKNNEEFVVNWHYFLNSVEDLVNSIKDDALIREVNIYILKNFYLKPYEAEKDFYQQYYQRMDEALGVILAIQKNQV